MRPYAVAGLQLNISGRQSNLAHLSDRLEMLMHLYPWVQMVVMSELASFGGWTGNALPMPNEVEDVFRRLAEKHQIWLLPGSLYEKTPEGIYNTTPVIDPGGNVVARYRKMFPFMPYEVGVEQGTEFCVFDVPDVGRFGVSICYDMWFPETSRTLASMGAEVLLHPTLTPSIDREVELAIAKATAATNQMFVIDINGVGDGGNGRSILVAPTGDALYEAGSGEEYLPIEIDLERVRRSREVGLKGLGQPLKSFRDRKVEFDVYTRGSSETAYLDTLGPLEKMARGSRAGLGLSSPLPPIARKTHSSHPQNGVPPLSIPGIEQPVVAPIDPPAHPPAPPTLPGAQG